MPCLRSLRSARARGTLLASVSILAFPHTSDAQVSRSELPSVIVEAPQQKRAARVRPHRDAVRSARVARSARPAGLPQQTASVQGARVPGSLTVLTAQQALAEINQTPGGVALVTAETYRNSTPANTIKDVLDYVPGVFAQPKWGDDTRLSIRGSGLSRNFHLRGVQLYMDGIPINTADGYGDFQEIDPTAYKDIEVYKGGNALQFGANSLGGAINFITPSGRDSFPNGVSFDVGGFGFKRLQANAGGANGPWDGFVTASTQAADGFRDHSFGSSNRLSGNFGYQFSPDVETRFYLNANQVRQRIPGTVTKASALTNPEAAAPTNVAMDQQRNIDTVRLANKTTVRFDDTKVEFGAFGLDRHLMHPIFQWLDYRYKDYGGFAKLTDDRTIGGFRNRLVAGVYVLNGSIDNQQFANLAGQKGRLLSSSIDRSENTSVYVEDSFYFLPSVAVIGGTQFLYATRNRQDRFLSDGDQSGATRFNLWSPKAGLLWQIDPTWQAFANVSRSAEVPSFGESSIGPGIPTIPFTSIRAQIATTYEVGTRMRRPEYAWELTAYRANIRDELQCLYSAFGNCNVTNADRTLHQGIEAGAGAAIFRDIFVNGSAPDKVWLNVSYTFNDFRFDRDPVFGDNQLPGAPRHYLRAELLYKHPTGLYVGPNVEWVPQAYFVDSMNTLKTEPYALLGLKAGFDNGGPLSAYVEGRNLTNKTYIASASIIDRATATSPLFEPGTGRAVYAGMRYRW
ncbi:TonB-dependent receptor [Bradyrhizobium sp. 180]|uniref:TonB-dependent receptor family protein n=1 Tax=unclassified Bradyrhizobium TaxID=2631580 RepID=UPI001FF71E64|nr:MULTISPECIES: TonB-dependent receptor [unclassified Bradyrhizobium]MCK1419479.1 TonB-dependent receptor [Bradyrhizobium sp. CW12]MCK1489880.1 TonB-dependent receptor [Bradyrhizobium sp. 180]MCK1527618.1 TonB-dependent receptor [Bradyrhizobium sp. 182]MCK1595700.1 TonB-dependent receptor [Bradyrhizobium sp. 164]MCK1649201.1 TonB-dependent receptor [Bradyrhizobium sp. 154]